MATAPAATIITPAVPGMPAILAFSNGELGIDTPLGHCTLPVEAVLTSSALSDFPDPLQEMADAESPKHLIIYSENPPWVTASAPSGKQEPRKHAQVDP
jgi:hypothetical protein